jgi:hypothetical protein
MAQDEAIGDSKTDWETFDTWEQDADIPTIYD